MAGRVQSEFFQKLQSNWFNIPPHHRKAQWMTSTSQIATVALITAREIGHRGSSSMGQIRFNTYLFSHGPTCNNVMQVDSFLVGNDESK